MMFKFLTSKYFFEKEKTAQKRLLKKLIKA